MSYALWCEGLAHENSRRRKLTLKYHVPNRLNSSVTVYHVPHRLNYSADDFREAIMSNKHPHQNNISH
jgi:hypothetical protein